MPRHGVRQRWRLAIRAAELAGKCSYSIYRHVYIYIYIYICVCVCVCVHIYVYMYIYMYTTRRPTAPAPPNTCSETCRRVPLCMYR